MAPRILLDNEFWTLSHEPEFKLIVLKRKPMPLPLGPGATEFIEAERAVSEFEPTSVAVLFDMREAPTVTDEKYERALRDARRRFVARFPVSAVLVKTAVGKLQVSRLAREEGSSAKVFSSEAEARADLLTRLREKLASAAPRRRT